MTRPRLIAAGGIGAVALVVILFVVAPRMYRSGTMDTTTATASPGGAAGPARKITATLFFVGEDGLSLEPTHHDVPFGEAMSDQARYIIDAQVGVPAPPFASVIPAGTKVRAVYVTDKGDAFVDFTGEIASRHTGGALDELLTVYAIVNALTVNLPAITRVQILIDGKEVDTLAGHVDLRQPLSKNLTWTKSDTDP